MNWLLTKFFPTAEQPAKIKVDDVILNIMAALRTRSDNDFLRQSVENIVCKVFRQHTKNNSDLMFYDILVPKQNVYSVQGNTIRIMVADGQSNLTMKAPLIAMVPFCGSYVSLKELKTHIPKDWQGWEPTVSSLGRHFLS
jgi:hypothetical protein